MKFLLAAIGTRGDMEPFLAIGEILQQRGDEVTYALPAEYTHLVPSDCPCHALSPRFLELVESEDGRTVMGKAPWWKKLGALIRMYRMGMQVNRIMNRELYDIIELVQPDRIIHHGKCNYPVLWGMKTGRPTVLVSPIPYLMHEVEGHAHVGFTGRLGKWLGRRSYRLANMALSKTIKDAQASLPGAWQFSREQILAELKKRKLAFTISPVLFARPANWPSQVQVLGYHERDKQLNWTPSAELEAFLQKNERPLLVTFGSMISDDPIALSKMVYQVLAELNIPAIINTAGGGLVDLASFQSHPGFFVVSRIPYDWVLPRVYGIVHHGGSGTTHSGLKYGCASLVLPHIMDQYAWNELVFSLGAGPKGCSINHLNAARFRTLVTDLMSQSEYRENARQLSIKMQEEELAADLYEFVSGD